MPAKTVGIRELKARLSHYMRQVKAGDTLVITEHNRPIGKIVPANLALNERLKVLVDAGLVSWSGKSLPEIAPVAKMRGSRTVADAKEAKSTGQKVIGISPMHFPEELVHASGALPVIVQESTEPVTDGLAHIFPNFCALLFTPAAGCVGGWREQQLIVLPRIRYSMRETGTGPEAGEARVRGECHRFESLLRCRGY